MLRKLFRSRPRRQAVRRMARPSRPILEALEDRLAPATVHWINPNGGDWGVASN